ncbi:MAG: hypothetical protein CMJ81_18670 [Planctomycetaceae bacterium]|nr:hypothetical protein [Planctomycetaceae bacterium]
MKLLPLRLTVKAVIDKEHQTLFWLNPPKSIRVPSNGMPRTWQLIEQIKSILDRFQVTGDGNPENEENRQDCNHDPESEADQQNQYA